MAVLHRSYYICSGLLIDFLLYRSQSLGPVTGDLLGDLDDIFDSPDGGDAACSG